MSAPYTSTEMMTIAAARSLQGNAVCFVGIGIPSAAANLARLTHAPDVVLIYESGTIGAKPDVLPLSIGDGELAETADTVVSVPEIFRDWLQGGRVDVGFLGAAQIDRFGRLNSTVIGGTYDHPKLRLPGAGGAPEIATSAKEVYVVLKQSRRSFVEKLWFVTSSGLAEEVGPSTNMRGRGVGVEQALAETSWPRRVAEELQRTEQPTALELAVLRDVQERTLRAHGGDSGGGE
jgi:glutaconate CoA-transferase subunit B